MRDGFDLLGALQSGGLGAVEAEPRCSRAACGADATTRLVWRNPRIHDESRRKVWLACDEHAEFLRDYLATRDFPVVVTDAAAPLERLPEVTA